MRKYLVFFFSVIVLNTFTLNGQEIVSPNKNIKVVITEKTSGQVYFRIMYKDDSKYVEVLQNSPLGISRKDQQFVNSLSLMKESKAREIHDKYLMITGKRKTCENFGTEKVFSYKNSNNQPLDIVFRVYNDGVAFRYVFPNHFDSLVNVTSEAKSFSYESIKVKKGDVIKVNCLPRGGFVGILLVQN